MNKKEIGKLNQHIKTVCEEFVKKYFGKEYIDDYWFVSENTPGRLRETLYINDFFFGIGDVCISLWYDVKKDDLLERYEQRTDPDNKTNINLYSWLGKKIYFTL